MINDKTSKQIGWETNDSDELYMEKAARTKKDRQRRQLRQQFHSNQYVIFEPQDLMNDLTDSTLE